MRRITMADLHRHVEEVKQRIGWVDDEASAEALRNKGFHRTPEKRELLARIEARARRAGKSPIKSYY